MHWCASSRYVNVGIYYLRQIFFAKYDIKLHTDLGLLAISAVFTKFLI